MRLIPSSMFSRNELFRLCNFRLDSEDTSLAEHPDSIYRVVQDILIKNQSGIHAETATNGYNLLHTVCSNPTLVNHKHLLQFLIATSEHVTELNEGTTSDRFGMKWTTDYYSRQQPQHRLVTNAMDETRSSEKGPASYVHHLTPTQARIVRSKTRVDGQTPLHVACQNPAVSPDIIQYLIQCYPAGVCAFDTLRGNLPLHYLCMTAYDALIGNGMVPSLESFILLIQHYPESCQLPDRDGNLPLHLLVGGKYCRSENDMIIMKQQRQEKEWKGSMIGKLFSSSFLSPTKQSMERSENESKKKVANSKKIILDCESFESGDSVLDETQISDEEEYLTEEDDPVKEMIDHDCHEATENSQLLLEIVQYIMDVNSSAMDLVNRHGSTPYDIAASVSLSTLPATSKREIPMITDLLKTHPASVCHRTNESNWSEKCKKPESFNVSFGRTIL